VCDSIPHSWIRKSIELVGVNSKIVTFCKLYGGEMEHSASFKYKAGSNTVVTHSDTKRNIPRGLSFAVTLLYSSYSINKQAEQN